MAVTAPFLARAAAFNANRDMFLLESCWWGRPPHRAGAAANEPGVRRGGLRAAAGAAAMRPGAACAGDGASRPPAVVPASGPVLAGMPTPPPAVP
ncbi:hypothetical protein GCM10027570_14760 [Streptomonospora sediminis]